MMEAIGPGGGLGSSRCCRRHSRGSMRKLPYPNLIPLGPGGRVPAAVLAVVLHSASGLAAGEAWWAYRDLVSPAVPEVKGSAWVRNPIDAFILSRLEARGLAPAGPAPRAALLRRVTYGL